MNVRATLISITQFICIMNGVIQIRDINTKQTRRMGAVEKREWEKLQRREI